MVPSSTANRGAAAQEIPGAPPPELLARALRARPGFCYLDSARSEEITGRAYSLIGIHPFLQWSCHGDRIVTTSADGSRIEATANPWLHLRELLRRYALPAPPEIPFSGGAIGYFGYEFGARSAGVQAVRPAEDIIPDAHFAFYDGLIACDLASGKTYAIATPVANRSAETILSELRSVVERVVPNAPDAGPRSAPPSALGTTRSTLPILTSNLTRAAYSSAVTRAKAYIAAGDIYQVNLAQRFELTTPEDPFAIYERLRRLNPAAFGAYLNLGPVQILSSSPELLARLDRQGIVQTRPIKGTRPRGRTPAEDAALAAELLASAKEQAELLMIVDLLRNDLGRVCRYGSIHVDERRRIETHPTVFHLVATISGQLAESRDLLDCLQSLLPGGSITGAPKIRAMQIIDELEPNRRDVYTGSIGYLGFDGTGELNIAIRTIVCQAGTASYHVGGGIVADSDPDAEYEETLAKGQALKAALIGQDHL